MDRIFRLIKREIGEVMFGKKHKKSEEKRQEYHKKNASAIKILENKNG